MTSSNKLQGWGERQAVSHKLQARRKPQAVRHKLQAIGLHSRKVLQLAANGLKLPPSLQLAACSLWLLLSGCSLSFTGAALDPSIKTFSVETFPNNSAQGPATLSQVFTDELRTFIQRNSNLRLDARNEGDVQYSGQITGYTVQPVNATAQGGVEAAGANRLTITVQVRFVNTKDPKQNFEQSFSQFTDFDRTRNANELDDAFIREIAGRLYLDIFNRSLSNW